MSPVNRFLRWYDACNYEEKRILRDAIGLMVCALLMMLFALARGGRL